MSFFIRNTDVGDGLKILAGKLMASVGNGLQINPTTKAIEVNPAQLPAPASPVKQAMFGLLSAGQTTYFNDLGETLTFVKNSSNIWKADIPTSWRGHVVVEATTNSNNDSLIMTAKAHIAVGVGSMDRILVAAINNSDGVTAGAVDLCVKVTRAV